MESTKLDFICNLCGTRNTGVEPFDREAPGCTKCRSSVRLRSVLYLLSVELFGIPLTLPDFPKLKSVRGMGMTDPEAYAKGLTEKFNYKNTFYDREPRLDITNIDGSEAGTLDFLLSSEVLEHVLPPFEKALENACRLLRPNGVLILTVPYGLKGSRDFPMEHFPEIADSGVVHLRSGPVMINRTASGELQIFDQLSYHGGAGSTLEMRLLTEPELTGALLAAGFREVRYWGENYPPFGIFHMPWSQPVVARKEPFSLGERAGGELIREFAEQQQKLHRAEERIESLLTQLEEATTWASVELAKTAEWGTGLDRQVEERTTWAVRLDKELSAQTEFLKELQRQFEERTKWALELDARVNELEKELGAVQSSRWHRLGRRLRALK